MKDDQIYYQILATSIYIFPFQRLGLFFELGSGMVDPSQNNDTKAPALYLPFSWLHKKPLFLMRREDHYKLRIDISRYVLFHKSLVD